jgi:CPA1 family monovalent cation:H+ antiporter
MSLLVCAYRSRYQHDMFNLLEVSALLLALSALFGWLNARFVRLPPTIAMLLMALLTSLVLITIDGLTPGSHLRERFTHAIVEVDFFDTLMHGMLAFLLFAGALQVDLSGLRDVRWPVGILATVGVLISTAVAGTGFWLLTQAAGVELPFYWALVFGALISPTDPVAVLSILKSVRIPAQLEMKIAGESLLNDGVTIVVFTVLLSHAMHGGVLDAWGIGELFLREAVGGVVLGLLAGAVAVYLMHRIDDYPIEILLSLALATCTYAAAIRLGASGPLAVVVAGLLVGNRGVTTAMSESTRRHLFDFWEVFDELLNSVLFLLIGFEMLVIGFDAAAAVPAAAAIPLVLVARFVSVYLPLSVGPLRETFTPGSVPMLTWGGLRGGISVALALSLPHNSYREEILFATYCVVVFSVVVQGLTIPALIHRLRFE